MEWDCDIGTAHCRAMIHYTERQHRVVLKVPLEELNRCTVDGDIGTCPTSELLVPRIERGSVQVGECQVVVLKKVARFVEMCLR